MNQQIISDMVGATVIFQDDGVPFYAPPQQLTGVIEAVRDSKYHGHYLTVAIPGRPLPKTIRAGQVVAFVHPSVTNEKAEVFAYEAALSA